MAAPQPVPGGLQMDRGVETVVVALAIDQLNQLLEAGELPLRAHGEGLHVPVQEVGVAES